MSEYSTNTAEDKGSTEPQRDNFPSHAAYARAMRVWRFGFDPAEGVDGSNVVHLAPKHASSAGRSEAMPLWNLSTILTQEYPECLIEDIVQENTLCGLFGPPNHGKSFLALDWACHIALGRPWMGREVKQGDVVYVFAEGSGALRQRLEAWMSARGSDARPDRLFAVPKAVQIGAETGDLIKTVRSAGVTPKLIVIDTLARTYEGDENATKDMSAFVKECDRLRQAFPGATVLVVHHTGKDASRGERGSTALRGALDASFLVKRDNEKQWQHLTLSSSKEKDLPPFAPVPMTLRIAAVGKDRKGKKVTSCYVVPRSAGDKARNATAMANLAGSGATFTEWQKASGLAESTFRRAVEELVEAGMVAQDGKIYRQKQVAVNGGGNSHEAEVEAA